MKKLSAEQTSTLDHPPISDAAFLMARAIELLPLPGNPRKITTQRLPLVPTHERATSSTRGKPFAVALVALVAAAALAGSGAGFNDLALVPLVPLVTLVKG
eukprot:CAMPEP_0205946094 /NCGR_PEP_ID=MMETSP1325-20131115/68161_1 /ASSEMBLY_ACC=CAM_ASM_000708 /TAXON_ID=236786 /ORGANISM="Florenciella sp., Strain RCC1007" /LENGTH=100 /DNA_ID=CAMNT_0053317125 /DNA_START=346 /DNA_END=645 /DNA_ORIENTATION=-